MTSLRRNRDALMAAKRALLEENDESASPALSLPDPSLRRVQSAEATAEAPKANPKAFSEFEHVQTTKLKQSVRGPRPLALPPGMWVLVGPWAGGVTAPSAQGAAQRHDRPPPRAASRLR
jgi:hypothetical protein